MPTNPDSLPPQVTERILSAEQLANAKRRARINAALDRERVANKLADLKGLTRQYLVHDVLVPTAVVGAAAYAAYRVVGALTRGDASDAEATGPGPRGDAPAAYAPAARVAYAPVNPSTQPTAQVSTPRRLANYLPVAIQLAKMGVSYLEKNGRRVPQPLHDLLAGPGVTSRQNT